MQNAVPAGEGAMIAILGMTIDEVEKEITLLPKVDVCEIANDNTDGQVVVSGQKIVMEGTATGLDTVSVAASAASSADCIVSLLEDV